MTDDPSNSIEALDEQHSRNRCLLRWIEDDLTREVASPEGVRGDGPLLGPLRSLREHLARHFDFEERTGLIERAILFEMNDEQALREWRGQHRDFLQRLDRALRALQEGARTGAELDPRFEPDLRAAFRDLGKHEDFENHLLGRHRAGAFRGHQRVFEERVD